jgi:DNA repair protein RadA/Sms
LAKSQLTYVCGACGAPTVKWQGQCPSCGEWNALEASNLPPNERGRRAWSGHSDVQPLLEISQESVERRTTGIGELDRVLGGGIVPGSVTLIGGDPGIGKSTLLLQACVEPAGAGAGTVLYVSGEESLQQISLRARRLGINSDKILVVSAVQIEEIVALAEKRRPVCVVVDSIQTVFTDSLPSAPGSVNQLRACTARLVGMAKTTGIGVILVGHVTKEGQIAGPRVLEHMVDTVLYFENEVGSRYSVIR